MIIVISDGLDALYKRSGISPRLSSKPSMKQRAGVVGAGPAGLCAARYALAADMEVTVFEQSDSIGGTWQYTDRVGTDSYGVPIHSSMYSNLRYTTAHCIRGSVNFRVHTNRVDDDTVRCRHDSETTRV